MGQAGDLDALPALSGHRHRLQLHEHTFGQRHLVGFARRALAIGIKRHPAAVDQIAEAGIGDEDREMRDLVALEERFPELVTPDSPTQRVGMTPADQEAAEILGPFRSLGLPPETEARILGGNARRLFSSLI